MAAACVLDSSEKRELNIQLNEKLFHHYGKIRTSYLLNIAEGLALHPQKKVSVIKGGIVYSSWNTTISMTKEDQWRSIQNTGLEWKRGGENARKILCTSRSLLFCCCCCFVLKLYEFTPTPLSNARLHESASLHITNYSTTALT